MFEDCADKCECSDESRVYVALSTQLFEESLRLPQLRGGFVCKVGWSSENCSKRRAGLNGERADSYKDGYGAVKKWVILKCWPVPQYRYDEKVFVPWMEKIPTIRRFLRNHKGHQFLELYRVDYSFKFKVGHPQHKWSNLNNEIIQTAFEAVQNTKGH